MEERDESQWADDYTHDDEPPDPYADDNVWLCCFRPTDEEHAPDCPARP